MARAKKKKPVNFRLIDRKKEPGPYRLMDELIARYHQHLAGARIALAWRLGWQPDKDSRLTLGQCKKASDLDRELRDWDAVILLNREVWEDGEFGAARQKALLDHELCHLQVAEDKEGEPLKDERGRQVYRIRKHDLEEFRDVVARHGAYKGDIQLFAKVLLDRRSARAEAPLFGTQAGPAGEPPASVKFTGQDMAFVKEVGEALRGQGLDVEENVTVHAGTGGPPAAAPRPAESSVASPDPPLAPDLDCPQCCRCGGGAGGQVVAEPRFVKAEPGNLIPVQNTVRSIRLRFKHVERGRAYLCGECYQACLDEDAVGASA